jgi:hypothetical protein
MMRILAQKVLGIHSTLTSRKIHSTLLRAMRVSAKWNTLCPDLTRDPIVEILAPESAKTWSQETEWHILDEETPVSRAFKLFMNLQLTLILFLALAWLYDHVWSHTSLK